MTHPNPLMLPMSHKLGVRKAGQTYEVGSFDPAAIDEVASRFDTGAFRGVHRFGPQLIHYVVVSRQVAAAVQSHYRCPFYDADRR